MIQGVHDCLSPQRQAWMKQRPRAFHLKADRPLRASQLHHAAVMTWTQLLLLHALCSRGIVKEESLRKHTCVQLLD